MAALRNDYPDQLVDRLKGPGEVGRQIISANATEAERYDYYKNVVANNSGVWRSGPGEMNLVGIGGKEYHDFIRTIQNGTNTDDLPYTVIDASKIPRARN